MHSVSVARGILALLALSFLSSSAEARDILQRGLGDLLHHDSDGEGACEEPPEGDWIVEHRFPSVPGNNTLAFQIRTIMSLRKVLDNVYQGNAGGVVFNAELPILANGDPVAYSFSGIWDPDTCVMSGVIVNFDQQIADPAHLIYDGEMLRGPYLNTDAGTVLFSRTGIFTLTLLEAY